MCVLKCPCVRKYPSHRFHRGRSKTQKLGLPGQTITIYLGTCLYRPLTHCTAAVDIPQHLLPLLQVREVEKYFALERTQIYAYRVRGRLGRLLHPPVPSAGNGLAKLPLEIQQEQEKEILGLQWGGKTKCALLRTPTHQQAIRPKALPWGYYWAPILATQS